MVSTNTQPTDASSTHDSTAENNTKAVCLVKHMSMNSLESNADRRNFYGGGEGFIFFKIQDLQLVIELLTYLP